MGKITTSPILLKVLVCLETNAELLSANIGDKHLKYDGAGLLLLITSMVRQSLSSSNVSQALCCFLTLISINRGVCGYYSSHICMTMPVSIWICPMFAFYIKIANFSDVALVWPYFKTKEYLMSYCWVPVKASLNMLSLGPRDIFPGALQLRRGHSKPPHALAQFATNSLLAIQLSVELWGMAASHCTRHRLPPGLPNMGKECSVLYCFFSFCVLYFVLCYLSGSPFLCQLWRSPSPWHIRSSIKRWNIQLI